MDGGTTYTWAKRNYFVRIPANYDPTKAYPVDMAGTGCGGGDTTGSGGDYTVPPLASGSTSQPDAIQIGLSYAESSAANPSCIAFTDDYVNSPEVQYIAAVVADISANYCVSTTQVFANGYSSGAFETVTAELSNPDKLRAVGIQIGGGLRTNHVPIMNKPIAAMFIVGTLDMGNPIGPLAAPLNDSVGSVAARDELLHRNGCVAADFQIVDTCATAAMRAANPPETPLPCTAGVADGDTFGNVPHTMWNMKYPKCQMYTNCPAKYPVVWCPLDVNHGNGPHPMGGDGAILETYRLQGLWDFYMSLPL